MSPNHRRLWAATLIFSLGVCTLAAWNWPTISHAAASLPLRDFIQYWAAGYLNASGKNPYDSAMLFQVEAPYLAKPEPIVMFNPPWVLALGMPFGMLPARTGHLIWSACTLAAVLLACHWLRQAYDPNLSQQRVPWELAIGLFWLPTAFMLGEGQISGFLLLGLAGFLKFERSGHDFVAGAMAVFIAFKPHLFILFWLALAVVVIISGRWRIVLGGVVVGIFCSLLAYLPNPAVFSQYLYRMTHEPPAMFMSPTLGTVLRWMIDPAWFRLQFVFLPVGFAWLGWVLYRYARRWSWTEHLPLVMTVSFVTSPYGAWPYDLVVMLVLIIPIAALFATQPYGRPQRAAVAVFAALTVGMLAINLARANSIYFFWVAPTMVIAYPLLRRAFVDKIAE